MRGGLSGQLRIGAIPTSLPSVSLLTTPLSRSHPGHHRGGLLAQLEADRARPGRVRARARRHVPRLRAAHRRAHAPLYQEHYVLLTDEDGPFGTRDEVTWAEAATLPLCLLTGDMQNRRIVDGIFHEAGAEPRPTVETNSISTLIAHVSDGPWSSVMAHAWLHAFEMPPRHARDPARRARRRRARSGSSGSTAIPSRCSRGRSSTSPPVSTSSGRSGGDALGPRVDVRAAFADEAGEGDAAIHRELDRERRRRADCDDDRDSRRRRPSARARTRAAR